jgi:hypothetical protein
MSRLRWGFKMMEKLNHGDLVYCFQDGGNLETYPEIVRGNFLQARRSQKGRSFILVAVEGELDFRIVAQVFSTRNLAEKARLEHLQARAKETFAAMENARQINSNIQGFLQRAEREAGLDLFGDLVEGLQSGIEHFAKADTYDPEKHVWSLGDWFEVVSEDLWVGDLEFIQAHGRGPFQVTVLASGYICSHGLGVSDLGLRGWYAKQILPCPAPTQEKAKPRLGDDSELDKLAADIFDGSMS